MNEYKLTSLPELNSACNKVAFRRVISDLSHRYRTEDELAQLSGLRIQEVRDFIDMLQAHGLIEQRQCVRLKTPPKGVLTLFYEVSHRWYRKFASAA